MKGILEKKEGVWFVKWSDTHSFAHGTIWMWTQLHPDDISNNNNLKEGDLVNIEFVNSGYDDTFPPFRYVKFK